MLTCILYLLFHKAVVLALWCYKDDLMSDTRLRAQRQKKALCIKMRKKDSIIGKYHRKILCYPDILQTVC